MPDTKPATQADLFDGRVIPSNLAVTAMRDSGYKNTAYAIAELIDNAQQAGADKIEVLCLQKKETIRERAVSRLTRIAVLDNGAGMDTNTLRKALQFGNGSRLQDRTGIGRFGMGLPNASISQASRVEVWTWQNGPDNAIYTFLSVPEMESGTMDMVPVPVHKPLPKEWRTLSQSIGNSGTIVVWSDLDFNRLTWKKGKSTLENTGRLAGRIYRKFLAAKTITIRLFCADEDEGILLNKNADLDDPMYLTPSSIAPKPFDSEPMFEFLWEDTEEIEYGGSSYEVSVRYSVAGSRTIELAEGKNRGDMPYGRHAAGNVGVSVLRAGRELMLDTGWCIGYDTRERWWGCEVEFPPHLDEVFGVTNNKQHAVHFAELASIDWQQLAEEGEAFQDVVDRLKEEGDPRGWLLTLSNSLRRNLSQIRDQIKEQGAKTRSSRKSRHGGVTDTATEIANSGWKDREEEVRTEDTNDVPNDSDLTELENDLQTENNYSAEDAAELVKLIKDRNLKVIFVEARFQDPYSLFDVQRKAGGITEVIFNQRHPAFDSIFGTINTVDEDMDNLSSTDLLERLTKAINASKIIFAAWARYEREANVERAKALEKVRFDWGKLSAHFLEPDSDEL
ncbi:ATP-binding protein [Hyphomonas oceanitis]|uniref:ATP-binding protein n=1 Tax=Hyphomonas oceanitis SCH89 TaxID=1280953 RepID=A0A059G1M3_9PROT|nr:ATP-binding protein [Hyphomonas oceanitis]KDA00716.1 hypothetical protein HOC_19181 [Hyphomonas oceanitis SCH89]